MGRPIIDECSATRNRKKPSREPGARMLEFAVRIAREAGRLLLDGFGKKQQITHKGRIDLVTAADLAAEQLIKERISAQFPEHQILAEETGLSERAGERPEYRWIVDPLDGTTNFAHGYPCFAVSIAAERAGEIVCGVVFDPVHDELYTAERGAGAHLNGSRIEVSETAGLSQAMLCTGFPYDVKTNPSNNLDHFKNFVTRAQAVRRDGSAALDLCYTACGRFDGFWELGLKSWDTAAGALVLIEAGGRITGFDGSPFSVYRQHVCASNGRIHEEMVEVLSMADVS